MALLIAVALLVPGWAKAQNAGNTIVFYADKQVSDSLWAPLFASIEEDLAKEDYGSASALLDRSPRLLRHSELFSGEEFSHVVLVKLLGRCDVAQQAYRPLKPGPLGWVLRVNGEIQPYIYIDCTRISQVLNPTTLGMSGRERESAMTQAIAHVLAHEWIHIVTQNTGHTAHGISQAQLTAHELVAEPEQARLPAEAGPAKIALQPDRALVSDEK